MVEVNEHQNGKNNLYRITYAGFLFFLPFSQALTIPVFFSLKISEILIIFYIFLRLLKFESIKLPVSKFFLLTYLFLSITLFSILINLFANYPYQLNVAMARLSPIGDSVLKFAYLVLAIICLFVNYKELIRDRNSIKYFFWGTMVACFYCWYLFLSGLMHLSIIILPGMEPSPQTIDLSIGTFIRCGTAKEGNYMALFLIIAGIIASQFKQKKLSVFFMCTTITTFSTVAIVCIVFYYILMAMYTKSISKFQFLLSIIVIVIVVTVASIVSADFRTIVINKIVANEETVDNKNDVYSRLDRLNSAAVGLEIFKDNPYWGVGMANYGLHFDHYNYLPMFDLGSKRIPNNIYIEILCESGLFALFTFFLLIKNIFNQLKSKFDNLRVGLIISLIYFFAFPSYTMLFIWMFIALIFSERAYSEKISNQSNQLINI